MPLGTVVYGAGQCVCDDPMLNDFVMEFVSEALPAIGAVSSPRESTSNETRSQPLEVMRPDSWADI